MKYLAAGGIAIALVALPMIAHADEAPAYEAQFIDADCEHLYGSMEYHVTLPDAVNFQVKHLGDGTGGDAETYYYADGGTALPGQIAVHTVTVPGEPTVIAGQFWTPGTYRVVPEGNRKFKQAYTYEFTVTEPDCEVEPTPTPEPTEPPVEPEPEPEPEPTEQPTVEPVIPDEPAATQAEPVVTQAEPTKPAELAATGLDDVPWPLIPIAAALVAVGIAMIRRARRARQSTPERNSP